NLKKPTAMNIIQEVGKLTYEYAVTNNKYVITFEKLAMHQSDTIRCYATYLAGLNSQWSIEQKLDGALNLIADKHFGVREVVWMALRPSIDVHLSKAIETLSTWTTNTDENIRRFITESTRPRGVWCKHIESLKEKPEQALPILAPLKSDTSVYVQNSVGNWLNDASKSQPDFVIELCERWKNESPTKDTLKIIKRARRTIDKK
ncbi:MAG: DNA alkylation repair protein, partial [Bacteroidota bacterium]